MGRGWGGVGRNIDVEEKHQSVAFRRLPDWGSNPQPLWSTGRCSDQLSHTVRAQNFDSDSHTCFLQHK